MPRKVSYGVDYDDGYDGYEEYDYDCDYDVEEYDVEPTEVKKEAVQSGIWRCSICTYDNEESMSACDICGVLRNPSANSQINCDKRTVEGICKDSGASIMAKSLFASLPHQTLKKTVVYQQHNDDLEMEEDNKTCQPGNIRGHFHEFHKKFCSHSPSLINIAPFKFDLPSPDDIVSSGLHSSKMGSKATFPDKRSSRVLSSIVEKSEIVTSKSSIKSSDSSSGLMQKDRCESVDDNTHLNYGSCNTESSEMLKSSVPYVSKRRGNILHESSSSSLSGGEPKNLVSNLNNVPSASKFGNSNNIKAKRVNQQAHFKPETWMLPEKAENTLTQLNLAIVGHVDSGKSTLSGRLLHLSGRISQKEMHKYQKEAKLQGKGSFAYAWALDESSEERERGITMTVAVAYFDSKNYHVVLLDSPGHKDFVPNMISGATQADAAILVIDASLGAFEVGMDGMKGQTREHAQLIRSFGVEQIIVAVNKMDSVEYSKDRFNSIKLQLGTFLRTCGFKDSFISWIPLSVMENQNLVEAPSDVRLSSWYCGPYLLDAIDSLPSPTRDFSKPLLMPVCDVIRLSSQNQVSACGKLEAGALRSGSKVLLLPSAQVGTVRSLERDSRACTVARAGDNVAVSLHGIDANHVMAGGVLCHPDFPVAVAEHLELKVLVLDGATPILIGSQLEFHIHHAKEAARVAKILSILDPKTGKVIKKAPRCLMAKQSAVLEVVLQAPVCVEEFSKNRALGRVFLRALGRTVAVGIVTQIIEEVQ